MLVSLCCGYQLVRQPADGHNGRLLFIGHHNAYVADLIWYSDDHGATYTMASPPQWYMDEVLLFVDLDVVCLPPESLFVLTRLFLAIVA